MTRNEIFKALATIDASYQAAGLDIAPTGDDQMWEVRDATGTPFHWTRARIDWAVDAVDAGLDIVASAQR